MIFDLIGLLIAVAGLLGAVFIIGYSCWFLLWHAVIVIRLAKHYDLRTLFEVVTIVAVALGIVFSTFR